MNSQTPHRSVKNPSIPDTINYMVKFAKNGAKNLDIRRLTEKICAEIEPGDYASEALACYYWVFKNIRYMRDIDNVEFLKTPERLIITRSGDCDDIATLLAAMLISCGNVCRFAIVDFSSAGRGPRPMYSHVFCQVLNQKTKQWITVDPVAGKKTKQMHYDTTAVKYFPFR